jgi:hypothetical protein
MMILKNDTFQPPSANLISRWASSEVTFSSGGTVAFGPDLCGAWIEGACLRCAFRVVDSPSLDLGSSVVTFTTAGRMSGDGVTFEPDFVAPGVDPLRDSGDRLSRGELLSRSGEGRVSSG